MNASASAAPAASEAAPAASEPVIEARRLHRTFPLGRDLLGRRTGAVRAVDGVDLALRSGETLGIVGESGSGKTTLGRILACLDLPDSGELTVAGHRAARSRRARDTRDLRRRVQVVFQDPYGSLDPTKRVGHSVGEPLLVHGLATRAEAEARAGELLDLVGLAPALASRYPRQLSGGQRQRVAIARAMALGPEILIADEPTSALDLSTRSGILNLLLELQETTGLSIVLISHDMATIRHMAHSVLVMYLGRVVEEGPTRAITETPLHPYTQALFSAVPIADPAVQRTRERIALRGEMPSPADPPSGCRFRTRCPFAKEVCAVRDPEPVGVGTVLGAPAAAEAGESVVAEAVAGHTAAAGHTDSAGHTVACHRAAGDPEYAQQPLAAEAAREERA
ncbi:ABC transporter ATP-binding protein [Brevibacterium album]|uniref:ABC transporter ATP-binding protein n=1 Tax=Brevibacterium album TaxID=417948 RepID=UPI0004103335|nr:oligopeptide/dipeptide ABC transporter ATP-binding protein [Brevibacterium album]